MKYADFKLATFMELNDNGKDFLLTISAKKKNGLTFMVAHTKFSGDFGASFTFFLGSSYTIATLKDGYVELAIPEKEEILKVKLSTDEEFESFIMSDYYGSEI